MFFDPWMIQRYGPKRVDGFTRDDMSKAFLFGNFAVLEFHARGGSIEELKDVLAAQVQAEINMNKGGMVDELFQKIDKRKKEIKEKANDYDRSNRNKSNRNK